MTSGEVEAHKLAMPKNEVEKAVVERRLNHAVFINHFKALQLLAQSI